ncbi:unnamed protein product (mitochondrion) [Plasmodiophora brassicae]|uniref:Uncharacterized protein n=1 Tax=Plasmodiophora brassicae TaxID=37360 RepID=A0A3P3XZR6_PLABS|nr:unnamed protein product [Plasmodiophora brassicae]
MPHGLSLVQVERSHGRSPCHRRVYTSADSKSITLSTTARLDYLPYAVSAWALHNQFRDCGKLWSGPKLKMIAGTGTANGTCLSRRRRRSIRVRMSSGPDIGHGCDDRTDDDRAAVLAEMVRLLKLTAKVHAAFQRVREHVPPDAFLETVLRDDDVDRHDLERVRPLLYMIDEAHSPLQDIVSRFYIDNVGTAIPQDRSIYTVVLFILLYRIDDEQFEFDELRAVLVQCHPNPVKVALFVQFVVGDLTDTGILCSHLSRHLDRSYTEKRVLNPLRLHQESLMSWSTQALAPPGRARVPRRAASAMDTRSQRQVTTAMPFSFATDNIPCECRIDPIRIDARIKATSTMTPALWKPRLVEINDEKKQRRSRLLQMSIKHWQEEHAKVPVQLMTAPARIRTDHVDPDPREQGVPNASSNVGMRTRPLTAVSLSSIPMSKSAILREECLARRRQESQVQVMKAFEVDMMDRLDFDEWRREQEARDEVVKAQSVHARKADAYRQTLAVRENRKQTFDRKKEQARIQDVHLRRLQAARRAFDEIDHEKRVHVARCIRSSHIGVPDQRVESLMSKSRGISSVVRGLLRSLANEKSAIADHRRVQVVDLVRRIRIMKASARARVEDHHESFDPTTSSRRGLMAEMSIVEMKQRGELIKEEHMRQLQTKQQGIQTSKQVSQRYIEEKTARVLQARETRLSVGAQRRLEKQAHREQSALQRQHQEDQAQIQCAALCEERDRHRAERIQRNAVPRVLSQKEHDENVQHERRMNRMMASSEEAASRAVKSAQQSSIERATVSAQVLKQEKADRDRAVLARTVAVQQRYREIDAELERSKAVSSQRQVRSHDKRVRFAARLHTREKAASASRRQLEYRPPPGVIANIRKSQTQC